MSHCLASSLRVAACSLALVAVHASAQGNGETYRVGQKVEAKSFFYTPPWQKAEVVSVNGPRCPYPEKPYQVRFTGANADYKEPCVAPDEIRPLAEDEEQAQAAPPPGGAGAPPQGQADPPRPAARAPAGGFKVGDRVDVVYDYARDKGGRATIVEVSGGRYKVHYDGCDPRRDAWIDDRGALHPAATISAGAAEIRFLVGNWAMFTPSYPNTVVHGNTVYREYGMGAKAPPLQIKADGSYVWYFDFGRPPARGRWEPHAKIEGTKYGTEVWDGVVIKTPNGDPWKVYRRISPLDNADHITAQTMCSGQTVIGTRI